MVVMVVLLLCCCVVNVVVMVVCYALVMWDVVGALIDIRLD